MMINAYVTSVILIFCSGLPTLLVGRRNCVGERLSVIMMVGGAILGLAAVIASGITPTNEINRAWLVPGGHFILRLDGLAAVFLVPAFLVSGLASIYALGYWPHKKHQSSTGPLHLFYGWLAGTIVLLPTIRNGILFLVVWEVMAIAGFFLILSEQEKSEVRRAAFIYLAATHIGTMALYGLFTLIAQKTGSFTFPEIGTMNGAAPLAAAVFLLALFGFGSKAGIMPLHIWLPGAHSASPSHASALMSGVMIKMGIYGIIRTIGFFNHIPPWWGWTILILGAVSGVMGVAFAIAQHDIKRLLAYHSVENIGIILLGIGVALLGKSYGHPVLVTLGMAGALLHVINHGLFKSLLFLSAGSMINATGTRHIDHYGGLLRRMPLTAIFFLGGAVAICGLPPLNGFVSEWLVYLGLLNSQTAGMAMPIALMVLAAPTLAMIGALAVACFVKVFGVSFLGNPRKELPRTPTESPFSMLAPMAIILLACVFIGTMPKYTIGILTRGLTAWNGETTTGLSAAIAPAGWISIGALILLGLIVITTLLWQRQRIAKADRPGTWGCGYLFPTSRMQYTASSFAEMITGLFHWGLFTETEGGKIKTLFAEPTSFSDHTPDVVLDRVLLPSCSGLSWLASKVRSLLQHGIMGIYMLYFVLALLLLLYIAH